MTVLRTCNLGVVSLALLVLLVMGTWSGAEPTGPSASVTSGPQSAPSGIAGGLAADIGVVCDQVGNPFNCQPPEEAYCPWPADIGGAISDSTAPGGGIAAAERIANDTGAPILLNQVCWWGCYQDFANPDPPWPDCSDDPALANATFTITIYQDQSDIAGVGCPFSLPGALYRRFTNIPFSKAATGRLIPCSHLLQFEYTATLPSTVQLEADTCYWVEIQASTPGTASPNCLWEWEWTAPGDGNSAQDIGGDGYVNGDTNDWDHAICLDVAWDQDSVQCDPELDPICEDFGVGPCALPHPEPGCEDPCCCTQVCDQQILCCLVEWDQNCADIALALGCATLGPPCPCDCEEEPDGTVDVDDFLALLAQWGGPGTCDCEDPPDGTVDVDDFLQMLAQWGPCA